MFSFALFREGVAVFVLCLFGIFMLLITMFVLSLLAIMRFLDVVVSCPKGCLFSARAFFWVLFAQKVGGYQMD